MENTLEEGKSKKVDKQDRTVQALRFTHGINNVTSIFVTTFLVSYIYSISDNYVLNVGLFYFFAYLFMFVFYFVLSHLIDKTNRVSLYRFAIIVRAIFIFVVIFYGQKLASMVILAGSLFGFSEGSYYTSYNIMKNELVKGSQIAKYSRNQYLTESFVNVVIPILLGTLIDAKSFRSCAILALALVVLQFIISFFIKSKRPENSSFDFKEFVTKTNNLGERKVLVKDIIIISISEGIITVISPLVTMIVMVAFDSNFSLGTITSLFSICSIICLTLLSKKTKYGKRGAISLISGILPVIFTYIMLFFTNKTTVILFNLVYYICKMVYSYEYDVSRNIIMKKFDMYDSIAEYQMAIELAIELGKMSIFAVMCIVGLIGGAYGTDVLLLVLKIFIGLSILIYPIINIQIMKYEKKYCMIMHEE